MRWSPTLGYSDIGVPITLGKSVPSSFVSYCVLTIVLQYHIRIFFLRWFRLNSMFESPFLEVGLSISLLNLRWLTWLPTVSGMIGPSWSLNTVCSFAGMQCNPYRIFERCRLPIQFASGCCLWQPYLSIGWLVFIMSWLQHSCCVLSGWCCPSCWFVLSIVAVHAFLTQASSYCS